MVTEYIIYTALTLSFGLLASILGAQMGALISGLSTEEITAGPSAARWWRALYKSDGYGIEQRVELFSSDFFALRPVPAIIFTGLTEFVILVMITRGILRLDLTSIVLTIVGLIIGVTLVSSVLSFIVSKLILNSAPSYKRQRERKLRLKRMRGTPTVKVYKCGICGATSPSGQYVVSGSLRAPAVVLCLEHSRMSSSLADAYECPYCGYRFDPRNNPTYFEEHRCANCNRELEYYIE